MKIKNVTIAGGGTLGSQIAELFSATRGASNKVNYLNNLGI